MLRHGQLAAAAGFWLALYTAVHFLALRFLPPKRFAQRAAHERNLFVQYALSAAKGAFVFAAAARIAFGDSGIQELAAFTSFDGPINGTPIEVSVYLYVGYALVDLVAVVAYYGKGGKGDHLLVVHHAVAIFVWGYILQHDFAYVHAVVSYSCSCIVLS